jgi:hypothetical protein
MLCSEEYAQFYGAMNTMNGRMVTMRKDGLPYEDMGYVPPPNRYDYEHAQGLAAI